MALLVATGLSLPVIARPVGDKVLSCSQYANDERELLGEAPTGARRLSSHILEIRINGGPRRFVDTPPYEPLGGQQWRYCGYDAYTKTHLIQKAEGGLLSGVLLFEENGRQLQAGHSVLFSPSGEEFLAIEQEDGMDGELWSLHRTDGTVLWKGYAGTIVRFNGVDSVGSTFEYPHWGRKGDLLARELCMDGHGSGPVTLKQTSDAAWAWVGNNCGSARNNDANR